jgi:hypothetical protein
MANDDLRHRLNAIVDTTVVGHDPRRVIDIAGRLSAELTESQAKALGSIAIRTLTQSHVARASAPLQGADVRAAGHAELSLKSYARARGLDASLLSHSRLEGSWCVWVSKAGSPEQQTVISRRAINPESHLRAELNAVLDTARDAPSHRSSPADIKVVHRLMDTVSDWQGALLGHTTIKTLSRSQIARVYEWSPYTCAAALRGDPAARGRCVLEINADEVARTIAAGAAKSFSMWTSKGHPKDERLVVTREATDALSYHQLHPDNRTRYLSLDGKQSLTCGKVLDRALSLMPGGSTVLVATDQTPEGRALETAVHRLAAKHPTLTVETRAPVLGRSWHEQLGSVRAQPIELASCRPARTAGLDR